MNLFPNLRAAGALCCCAALACGGSTPATPVAPTEDRPSLDSVPLDGTWEGTFAYGRVEPSGCVIIGLGTACPEGPVPVRLSLTQDLDAVTALLWASIYGLDGASVPFPLFGRFEAPASLLLEGEEDTSDPSCNHASRRRVTLTLRRTSPKSLEGALRLEGDRRLNSCFFYQPQVYGTDVRLMRVAVS